MCEEEYWIIEHKRETKRDFSVIPDEDIALCVTDSHEHTHADTFFKKERENLGDRHLKILCSGLIFGFRSAEANMVKDSLLLGYYK